MTPTIELNESNFDREMRQARQPVVVDFWAPWCGPCRMLGPVLDEIAREQEGLVTVAKVNVDEYPELANRYRIESVPSLLYFRDGEVRDRTVGVVSKRAIITRLDALRAEPANPSPV
jgi:thioredoxin 1